MDVPNVGTFSFIKQTLDIREQTSPGIIIIEYFNTSLLLMDYSNEVSAKKLQN